MSRLPLTSTEYAIVLPSGDKLGDVSSPAASVIRVNEFQRAAGGGAAAFQSHDAAVAITARTATVHGTHRARSERTGTTTSTAGVVQEDAVDSVSSANARSLADWNRRSGDFSRQRLTIRSRPAGIDSRAVSRSGGS